MGKSLQLRVPPVVVLLVWALWLWLLYWADIDRVSFTGQRWLAGMLSIAGLAVAASGVAAFRAARTTVDPLHPNKAAHLVTGGIYRLTRNPMYLGMALLLFGWAVLLGSALGFLLVPLFMVYLTRFQIVPEERMLMRKFGGAFQRYRARVRRWL